MHILSKLGSMIAPLLGVYLAFKIGDMFIRKTFVYLSEVNTASVMFTIEVLFGVIIPLRMFLSPKVLKSPGLLFTAASLVVFGVLLNRINNFIVAYSPPYSSHTYFPAFGEFSVTIGLIAILILLYRVIVMNFPVISLPGKQKAAQTKYTIKGTK
jgi:Ni/Fe-hydrogenase subunit HybB-like protein